jgi:hypothetical protein
MSDSQLAASVLALLDGTADTFLVCAGAGSVVNQKTVTQARTLLAVLPLAGGTMVGDIIFTDATYDIGKSGATRPRDGFFSRNMVVGGAIGIGKTPSSPVHVKQPLNNNMGAITIENTIGNQSTVWAGTAGLVVDSGPGLSLLVLQVESVNRVIASSAGVSVTGGVVASTTICAGTYTVGTLPSAAANAYKFATVSDSSVTTFGSTVAGGGSSKVMVFSNGTNWTVFAI